ncbi:MAG: RNA polymerase sigma factor [Clostridia bacterium]|nr:RNA polymerase sigma factor [Clostridia bacterium]
MDNGASSYRRFLDGDENALTEIVSQYRPGLQSYINSIVNNYAVAEDLTEDTFVKLLLKKPKDKGTATFKTWLYTIGRNMAIDYLRKNPCERYVPLDEIYDIAGVCETECSDDMQISVRNAMEHINYDYKNVLILFYFENFTIEEISKIIKKPKKGTSVLLHRARKAMKKQLEKEQFNYEN